MRIFWFVLLGLLIAIGAAVLLVSSARQTELRDATPAGPPPPTAALRYVATPIGAPASTFGRPLVTNVKIVDLDQDGLLDVLYCEAQQNSIRWVRQAERGVFVETVLGEPVPGPANIEVADVTGDGRLDILVASMGQITPINDRIGAVVLLENMGDSRFRNHVILDQVARVTDVQAADLNDDGRLDLVVGQFGYDQGEIRWLENRGDGEWVTHRLLGLSGTIHTPVADFDGDGRPDVAALVSQEWEEVHLFRNRGDGRFHPSLVWGSTNEDYGSSGLTRSDLNRDGRPDLLYTNGDGFDYAGQGSRPWHGLQWLENVGSGQFRFHRVGAMPGAYAPQAADLNGDGALDLVAVSCFADWQDPRAISLMAWLNNGQQQFTPVPLAHAPTHLVTLAVGDLDGNGRPVLVTGGWHLYPPYDRMSSVLLWRRQ